MTSVMSLLDWLCFYLFNLVHVFNQVQSHLLCLQILNSSFLVEILLWVKGSKTIVYFLKTKAMICLQLSVSLVQSCQTCQSFPLSPLIVLPNQNYKKILVWFHNSDIIVLLRVLCFGVISCFEFHSIHSKNVMKQKKTHNFKEKKNCKRKLLTIEKIIDHWVMI